MSRRYNLIHASDSAESARREIGILFEPGEMQDYSFADGSWIDETSGTPSAKPRGTFPEETERKRNTLGARLDQPAGTTLEEAEKSLMRETLRMVRGNREQAAEILGIGVRTLYRKITEYDLRE